MPFVNTVQVTDRHNRPTVLNRVLLRTFFLNDGQAINPFAIRSVHIFRKTDNIAPNTVLGDDGLISADAVMKSLMVFTPSNETGEVGVDNGFIETMYDGDVGKVPVAGDDSTTGIYHLGFPNPREGEFAVVLDGINGKSISGIDEDTLGLDEDENEIHLVVQNTASAVSEYLDVWTVKFTRDNNWTTVFNNFELFSDTFVTLTQPLLFQAKNKLFNKHVKLGSKVDIKVGTEVTIQNKDIDDDIKNTLKGSAISDAIIKITKQNEDSNLPSRALVVSSSTVDVTSDNTIVYNWNTKFIQSLQGKHDLGSSTGTYSVQVEYNFYRERIVSPLFYLIIN